MIKIGSSTLTTSESKIDYAYLAEVTDQVARVRAAGWRPIVVTSAAIACGLERLSIEKRPHDMPSLQAAASVGQSALSTAYAEAFARHGIVTSTVLLTRRDTADRRAYLHARDTFDRLLELGVVPIVNENDTISVEQIRFGDNDTLAALVACLVEADLMVILSDIEGLYDANPHHHPDANLIGRVEAIGPEIMAVAGEAGTTVGSGGMITKIKAARVLMVAGIPLVVCDGHRAEAIVDAAAGEDVGTLFVAAKKPHEITPKKLWIALGDAARGALAVTTARRRRSSSAAARFCRWACARWKGASRRTTSSTSRMRRGICSRAARWRSLATRRRWPSGAPARSCRRTACWQAWPTSRSSIATSWSSSNRGEPWNGKRCGPGAAHRRGGARGERGARADERRRAQRRAGLHGGGGARMRGRHRRANGCDMDAARKPARKEGLLDRLMLD